MLDGGIHGGGLAGAQLAVDLQNGLVAGHLLVLGGDGLFHVVLPAEDFKDLGVGAHKGGEGVGHVGGKLLRGHVVPHPQQSPEEGGDGELAVFVDAHAENVAGIAVILQPGAPVGDDGGFKQLFAGGVVVAVKVNPRAADQLGDDDPLRPVDDEGAGLGHQGEIPHVDVLLLHLAGLLIQEAGPHPHGGGIGGVPLLAFRDGILRLVVQPVADEVQHQIALVIGDG